MAMVPLGLTVNQWGGDFGARTVATSQMEHALLANHVTTLLETKGDPAHFWPAAGDANENLGKKCRGNLLRRTKNALMVSKKVEFWWNC